MYLLCSKDSVMQVCSLLHWAAEHRGLSREGDAMARDGQGCTPLVYYRKDCSLPTCSWRLMCCIYKLCLQMRACARGKAELSTILYHWNSGAMRLKNR